jgi:predicted PurR-regulated permease PerM
MAGVMTELPPQVAFLREQFVRYRDFIVAVVFFALVIWLMFAVREVTTLLLLSYVIAVLIDPVVKRLERWRLSRPSAIMLVGSGLIILLLVVLLLVIPPLLGQLSILISRLPGYIESLGARVNAEAQNHFGVTSQEALDAFWVALRERVGGISGERVRELLATAGATLMTGYSITLTLVNVVLLPFFVFYIANDLRRIHAFMGRLLSPTLRAEAAELGGEVLIVMHAFLRGQLTVSALSAVLYGTLLSVVGLQSGFAIGLLTGFLNLVPYLGTALGLTLASVIALVTMETWTSVFLVWGAFALANFITDNFISPKVMGENLGLHPLGVMLALIVGGNLLGLLGIVIAIPAAAILRVLYHHFELPGSEAEPVLAEKG